MLAQVTCALYWINPLAWMAAKGDKRIAVIYSDEDKLDFGGAPETTDDDGNGAAMRT